MDAELQGGFCTSCGRRHPDYETDSADETAVYAGGHNAEDRTPGRDTRAGDVTEVYHGSGTDTAIFDDDTTGGDQPNFCRDCGTDLRGRSGARFCPGCGGELRDRVD
jgi:hypothetical protein